MANQKPTILLVDDHTRIRETLRQLIVKNAKKLFGVHDISLALCIRWLEHNPCQGIVFALDSTHDSNFRIFKNLIRKFPNIPIIVLVDDYPESMSQVVDALGMGAKDFIIRPSISDGDLWDQNFSEQLIHTLIRISEESSGTSNSFHVSSPNQTSSVDRKIKLVAIGASTGGPKAIAEVLKSLPENFSLPILIVQHMPPNFTSQFVQSLNALTSLSVLEGKHQALISQKEVWVAPGNKHMRVSLHQGSPMLSLSKEQKVNFVRPSVDVLFESVANTYGKNSLGVILTGMGKDGLEGSMKISDRGGLIFAQDKNTSMVWGMPGQVSKHNIASAVLPLSKMATAIMQAVSKRKNHFELSSHPSTLPT